MPPTENDTISSVLALKTAALNITYIQKLYVRCLTSNVQIVVADVPNYYAYQNGHNTTADDAFLTARAVYKMADNSRKNMDAWIALGRVNIDATTALIAAGHVTQWSTETRPEPPIDNKIGKNTDLGEFEYYDGAEYQLLFPVIVEEEKPISDELHSEMFFN